MPKLNHQDLKQFHQEVNRLSRRLKEENSVIQGCFERNFSEVPLENLKTISEIFSELGEICEELNVGDFKTYFEGFSEVIFYSTQVDNLRTHKKMATLIDQYNELLMNLSKGLYSRDKMKGIKRALEVSCYKTERIKRGDLFSFFQEDLSRSRKRAAS